MFVRSLSFLIFIIMMDVAVPAALESRVEAVTVYPSGAIVTRVATTNLSAGENKIRLVNLVASIEAEFLQVEIADSGVRIGQIRLGVEQQRDSIDSEVASIAAQIQVLINSIKAVDDSSAAAQLRLKFLDGLAQGYAKEAWMEGGRGTASIDSLQAALDLLQSGSENASALIRDNVTEKLELEKDLSVLQRSLADLRGGALQTVAAELTVNSNRATTTEVRVRYFQKDAGWSPLYESRLDSNTGALELIQKARVEQSTAEDWSNVTLTLSTSEPSGELIAPTVDSEFLNIYEPPSVPRLMVMQSASAFEDGIEEIVESGHRITELSNFAVNYDIPGLSNIPNDSEDAVSFDLERFQFDTELVTQVVPRESTQAFLAARFVYNQSVPLYSSEMLVFVDDVFAGFSEMPTVLPKTEVLLPVGQDRRVEVKAETQGGEDGTSGIIGRRKSEVTDYVFEITNRRDQPGFVEVLDRIPVARNREIDVDVPTTATTPTEKDLDDQPGLVMWSKTVGAGESWRIRHQYTVSYPEKYVLIRQ